MTCDGKTTKARRHGAERHGEEGRDACSSFVPPCLRGQPLNPRERLRLNRLLTTRTVPRSNGCLEWTGGTKSGSELYGAIWFRGRSDRVHRVMVMLNGGEYPPADRVVRHLCGNAACINPEHLAVGTSSQNRIDTFEMGRVTQRKRLDPRDERRIRQLFFKGRSSWRIAERLKLARTTVNGFIKRSGLCRPGQNNTQSEDN